MRLWLVIGIFFLSLLSLPAQDRGMGVRAALEKDASMPASHALIIGIGDYQYWQDLRRPRQDATELADLLRAQYGFGDVRLLLDEQATRKAILTELEKLIALDRNNSVLIFYAGHGGFSQTLDDGYWVSHEAEKDASPDYIANITVQKYVSRMKARHVLILSDSCFSGALLRGDNEKLPASLDAEWYRRMIAKPSRYVITSGDLESVPDNSIFATKLLNKLRYAEQQVLSAKELALQLEKEIPQFSKQTVLGGRIPNDPNDENGQFVFVACRTVKPPPVPPAGSTVDGPVRVVRSGTLVVKSPERGEVRVGNGAAAAIEPSAALRWEKLAVGKYPVIVTAGGVTWTGEADVREGQVCELEAVFVRGPKPGEPLTVDLGGGEKLEMVWIEPGSFTMGSPADEQGRYSDEVQHPVTLRKGFWMGKYEVTQGQWERVMGNNPANFKGARNPVEQVSWEDCQEFVRKLNALDGGRASPRAGLFRLPTEAEWEYACRAGTTGAYAGSLDELGWYGESWERGHHPVGQKKANAWGVHDMHGNVWEWCQDWYGDYPAGSVTDPAGPGSGSIRVIRGGSWSIGARGCRSANRGRYGPGYRYDDALGLRLVMDPQQP